jgi:hypothetical protein
MKGGLSRHVGYGLTDSGFFTSSGAADAGFPAWQIDGFALPLFPFNNPDILQPARQAL